MFEGRTDCGNGKAPDLIQPWGLNLADITQRLCGFSELQFPPSWTGCYITCFICLSGKKIWTQLKKELPNRWEWVSESLLWAGLLGGWPVKTVPMPTILWSHESEMQAQLLTLPLTHQPHSNIQSTFVAGLLCTRHSKIWEALRWNDTCITSVLTSNKSLPRNWEGATDTLKITSQQRQDS